MIKITQVSCQTHWPTRSYTLTSLGHQPLMNKNRNTVFHLEQIGGKRTNIRNFFKKASPSYYNVGQCCNLFILFINIPKTNDGKMTLLG